MEPVTLVLIAALFTLLTGSGAGAVAMARRRQKQILLMRDAVIAKAPLDGQEISIFDIFWDLGVSDYALEIMGSQGYLLDSPTDLHLVHNHIAGDVATYGSYSAFIRENLETIQEFYDEHRRAGHRRQLPSLENRQRKTLSLPAPDFDDEPPENPDQLPVPARSEHLPVVARGVEDRISARRREGPGLMPLQEGTAGLEIDVDEVSKLDPMRLLDGLFSGNLTSELSRWWEMRTLRGLRKELDDELTNLYYHLQFLSRRDTQIFDHLYDTARRWDMEARRIEALLEKEPWEKRSWSMCAEALTHHAHATARQLAELAESNVDRTIERIRQLARKNDTAMAGYLVYLNRHAFFAGRGEEHGEHVRRIDATTYRMREELRQLLNKGVI